MPIKRDKTEKRVTRRRDNDVYVTEKIEAYNVAIEALVTYPRINSGACKT